MFAVFYDSKFALEKLSENLPSRSSSFTIKNMLHDFSLAGERVRLWQRVGESYEHVLMKALGYAMFVKNYPNLEIETTVGLRYKPDLIAFNAQNDFAFWGECGQNAIRKTHWILKHTRTEKLVLFKIGFNAQSLIKQLREEIPAKYRMNGKLSLINFVNEIVKLTESKQIAKVSKDWFSEFEI
jgi:hypothetical protein